MTSQRSRADYMAAIVDAGLRLCINYGIEERLDPMPGPLLRLRMERFELLHTRPRTGAIAYGLAPYHLDIWATVGASTKKVFSVQWSRLAEPALPVYELIRLDAGSWRDEFLKAASGFAGANGEDLTDSSRAEDRRT